MAEDEEVEQAEEVEDWGAGASRPWASIVHGRFFCPSGAWLVFVGFPGHGK